MRNKRQTLAVICAVLFLATTSTTLALAAPFELDKGPIDKGGGGGLTGIIDGVIGLIVTIAKPLALLGVVAWGAAQFIQPFAPEVNSKFQGYAKLVMGAVLVLGAGDIVDFLWGIG